MLAAEHTLDPRRLEMMRIARKEYFDLGPSRSIPKLRNRLRDLAASGQPTSSRNNQQLTNWRREYMWDQWCESQGELLLNAAMVNAREARTAAINNLTLSLFDANAQLHNLITNPKTPGAVRLKSIELLYRQLGIAQLPSKDDAEDQAMPEPPPADASAEAKTAWLARIAGN